MGSNNVFARGLVAIAIALTLAACPEKPHDPGRPDANVTTADSGSHVDTGSPSTEDAFVPPVDAYTPPTGACRSPAGECDLMRQDCADGQICVFALPSEGATTPETVCAPIFGSGAEEGRPCCALNSCDRGLACVGAVRDGDSCSTMGVCRRYCCGSSTVCAAGQICDRFTSSFEGGVCDVTADCDLIAQTGCPTGQACYPGSTGLQCVGPSGANKHRRDACEYINDCEGGTTCIGITRGSERFDRCLGFCRLRETPSGCSDDETCQAVEGFPAGIGSCIPNTLP